MDIDKVLSFYKGKRVLVTGATGFKGSWLCHILIKAGAEVTGFSLAPPTEPSIFCLTDLDSKINSIIGDVRNYEALHKVFNDFQPEIVMHLAAQPLVRESYTDPKGTYETNVIGTLNVLECIRATSCVISALNVTTDKVYENKEWEWGYRENEALNGYDPYSNSKSCSEMVTQSYNRSFFKDIKLPVSTARAGNVLGGGDFAADRIIPDCIRAVIENKEIEVRNPFSTRPYQHVLEPLFAYLLIAYKQYEDFDLCAYYNVGPNDEGNFRTGELVDLVCRKWGSGANWVDKYDGGPHEASFLKLDCSKIKKSLEWHPVWSLDTVIEKTLDWTRSWQNNENISECMAKQISAYMDDQRAIN